MDLAERVFNSVYDGYSNGISKASSKPDISGEEIYIVEITHGTGLSVLSHVDACFSEEQKAWTFIEGSVQSCYSNASSIEWQIDKCYFKPKGFSICGHRNGKYTFISFQIVPMVIK